MRTRLRSNTSLLFIVVAVLVAVPVVAAFAENLQDEITTGGSNPTRTIATGTANAYTNKYFIQDTGSDGCKATAADPAIFKLTVPANVTATSADTMPDGSPKLVFTGCGTAAGTTNKVPVTFSSNTVNNTTGYTIDASYVSGGGGTSNFNTNPADSTLKVVAAPTVTGTSPANDAAGVAVTDNVTATFSQAMDATTSDGDPSTITTSTFKLVKDGTTTALSAVYTYNSTTNTATLNPDDPLLPGTKYNVTVVSGGVKTPEVNQSGEQIAGGYTLEQDETWSFTTLNPNTAPVADNDSYNVNEGGTLNVPAPGVLGNDTDANSNPLTAALVGTGPSHDSSFTFNSDGSFVYTHDGSETTSDSFTYKANDGQADSNTVTVTITIVPVNDVPTCQNVAIETDEDTQGSVAANCSDADGDLLTYAIVDQATDGTASVDVSTLRYDPEDDFNGSDSFTYRASDGTANSAAATVGVTVNPVNDPPPTPGAITSNEALNNDGTFTLNWGASIDVDGDNVTYTLEHRDFAATSDWSEVASGLNSASYTFGGTNAAEELEGLWDYRVKAVDSPAGAESDFSTAENLVKVDQTNPDAPTLSFATGTGQSTKVTVGSVDWYKDSALINVSANGDPNNARDGSPGSGVNAASFPASFSVTTNGTSTASKTVKDNATNESAAGTLPVNVDAANPTLGACPTAEPFLVNSGQQPVGPINASDGESGIDSANSQLTKSVDTSSTGTKTVTFKAQDRVGHSVTKNCDYTVGAYDFVGFTSPVDNQPTMNSAKAGSAIPLKWRLMNNGTPVTNLQSVTVTASSLTCSLGTSTDLMEEYASGSSGLQNLGDGYYQFNWKTPTTYVKSCKSVQINGVGMQLKATQLPWFQFTK